MSLLWTVASLASIAAKLPVDGRLVLRGADATAACLFSNRSELHFGVVSAPKEHLIDNRILKLYTT